LSGLEMFRFDVRLLTVAKRGNAPQAWTGIKLFSSWFQPAAPRPSWKSKDEG